MTTYGSGGRDMGDMAEKLGDLMRLDVDAVAAYNEAIEKTDSQDIRSHLSTYRDDHQRHVNELTQVIRGMGEEPPKQSKDIKGLLIEGMTKLRSAMGDEQALKAMHQNEEVTNKAYDKAAQQAWPADAQEVVQRGLADERRHIQWIDQELSVVAGAKHSDESRGDY